MMLPLAFLNPRLYFRLRGRATARHAALGVPYPVHQVLMLWAYGYP